MSTTTIRVRCDKCRTVHTVRVTRSWPAATVTCCRQSGAWWLNNAGDVMFDGARFSPA